MAASYLRRGMHGPPPSACTCVGFHSAGVPGLGGARVVPGLPRVAFVRRRRLGDPPVGFDARALEDFRGVAVRRRCLGGTGGPDRARGGSPPGGDRPVAVAQLVETYLLNRSRCTDARVESGAVLLAADGRDLVTSRSADARLRGGHGDRPCQRDRRVRATSNVEAARRYGLRPPAPWRIRSSRPSRPKAMPSSRSPRTTRSPTSSSTPTTPTACGTRSTRSALGSASLGVRLDSGDLDALARARALLDEAGLLDARIFASGGLDELQVDGWWRRGAVDAFGVGTQMGVSADAPYVDSVYKLMSTTESPAEAVGGQGQPARAQAGLALDR